MIGDTFAKKVTESPSSTTLYRAVQYGTTVAAFTLEFF